MKKVLLFMLLLRPVMIFGQQKAINWMTIEEAIEAQKDEPRKILMDVYTKWCGPCKMMMKNTFTNADVIDYVNTHFYAVKFDAEGPDPVTYKDQEYTNPTYVANKAGRNGVHQLSMALGVKAYPTIVYFDAEGNIITGVSGYKTPQQLEYFLKVFAQDDYLQITTQEEAKAYQEGFKYEFQ